MSKYTATFDLLWHQEPCLECGAVPSTSFDLDMQTKIAAVPENRELSLGSEVSVADDLEGRGHLQIGARDEEDVKVIEHWVCGGCAAWQWAVLEVAGHRIQGIRVAPLDVATLESVGFVTNVAMALIAREGLVELDARSFLERRTWLVEGEQRRRITRTQDLVMAEVAERGGRALFTDIELVVAIVRKVAPPGYPVSQALIELGRERELVVDGDVVEITAAGRHRIDAAGFAAR